MQENELKLVLQELYRLDPDLQTFEDQLKPILLQMSELRPDTKFTPALAAKIKAQVLRRIAVMPSPPVKSFIFNFMNKKLYTYTLSAVVLGLVVFMVITTIPQSSRPISQLDNNDNSAVTSLSATDKANENEATDIVRLAAGAFGSLTSVAQAVPSHGRMVLADGITVSAEVAEMMAPAGLGGDSNATAKSPNVVGDQAISAISSSGSAGIDMKMIAPAFNFNYVYQGDPLVLTSGEADVYRRLKGVPGSAQTLTSLVSNLELNGVSLNSFRSLDVTSLTLQEGRDKGLAINFDFLEGTVNIYENWQRWRLLEREACGGDESCWQKFRLKLEDVPSNESLIAMANDFIAKHQINLQHYGQPEVDNAWRQDYERVGGGADFYIPEYATVIYPLLVADEPVRDQGGNYVGLRVSINLLQQAVSGLSNLAPYRYEASAYELETSADRIMAVALKGGWNRSYFSGGENTRELFLGTPTKSFVQIWHYVDNRSDELLVPALVFPVINMPTEGYYGQRFVTVPLVKELLAEIEQGYSGDGEIMPMVKELR